MKENLKIAIDFAEKIKNIKGILQIILFGSVSTGEDRLDSDIDIAIIYEEEKKFEIMKKVNNLKPEKIQTTFLDIKDLPKETELIGSLSGEGALLHGKPIILNVNKLDLNPKIIISYSLASLKQTDKVKVNRALYGSTSKSKFKGKEYITKTTGLLKEEGIEKINDCVLLVDRRKSIKIINMLKRFQVHYREIPVWGY